MSENVRVVRFGGIGLGSAMFLVFLTLQLTGHIDWPWYAVAAPLWVPLGIGLALIALGFAIGGVLLFFAKLKGHNL